MHFYYNEALLIGSAAFLFTDVLTKPSEIFAPVSRVISWLLFRNGKVTEFKKGVKKVLLECSKCFSGQLAFWSYFVFMDKYSPINHLALIVFSIMIAFTLSIMYEIFIIWKD